MGPLVFKIRKYDDTLFHIGHDESSIHPLMTRLGKVIKKVSKKKAIVADTIKNGQLRGKEMEIEGIPPTDWTYNTKEATRWSWLRNGTDEEEYKADEVARDVPICTVVRCKEDGLSARETASYVPYGKTWVGDRWKEYKTNGEHQDVVDRVEDLTG